MSTLNHLPNRFFNLYSQDYVASLLRKDAAISSGQRMTCGVITDSPIKRCRPGAVFAHARFYHKHAVSSIFSNHQALDAVVLFRPASLHLP